MVPQPPVCRRDRFDTLGGSRSIAQPIMEGTVLKAGEKAPATTGTAYDGRTFDLGAPGMRTVLFFYPKANTPG